MVRWGAYSTIAAWWQSTELRVCVMCASGEMCGNSSVVTRDSCSLKSSSSLTDHRHHHSHRQLQQLQHHHQTSQLHQTSSVARGLQPPCYDDERRLHNHQPRPGQPPSQQRGDTDHIIAASSSDHIGLQRDAGVRLDHYSSKLIKSEPPTESSVASAVVSAAARELADPKTGGGGGGSRTTVGSKTAASEAAAPDTTIDSQLRGVSSTSTSSSSSSSSLNDVITRHHHQQHQTADIHQTSGSCSFTVSSLVHPTTGSSSVSGLFASVVDSGLGGRDISVDGVLSSIDRDVDSTCFDASTAAAAAQWFAGHQQGGGGGAAPHPGGYSARCTPEFYMQRLQASIAADRRHCLGPGDVDADAAVPSFSHHAGAATWYGAAQSSDVISSPGPGAYISDVFDVSAAATRMLSTRQSCAQLQATSPFRVYYGSGGTHVSHVNPGPATYTAYAEDCAIGGKY